MKISASILMVAAAFVAGCGDSSKPGTPANTVSNVVAAPANYVGAVVQAQKYAEKQIDVSYINQDIQMFNASEGRYPKDLQELIPNYLPKMPAVPAGYKLVYDTNTHTVSAVKE
jgi:hypothetical protein